MTPIRQRLARALGRAAPTAGGGAPPTPAPCLGCRDKLGRPTPVEPIPGRTATSADVVIPLPDTFAAAIDGHLVVLDVEGSRGLLLNGSAALILTAFDGERTVADVVTQLVGETGMDEALITGDVRATVDRLLAQGVVTLAGDEAQGEPGPAVTGEGARRLEPDRWAPAIDRLLSGVPWVWERGAMRLAATSVRVRADDADVGSLFDRLLGGLVDEEAALLAQHTLSVVSRRGRNAAGDIGGAPRYRVVLDGRVVARVDSPESAVVHALHHLDELAVSGSSDALVFHAGAVERDDRVVVVLGVSGRGKSTLTAALVSRGFRYLSDEVVAVDIATSGVWPYPKALDLHPGSLDLLGLDAGAASLQLPWSKVKVLPDRLGEVSRGGKAALLVFLAETLAPVATPGAAPVEVVPPAEALVAILPVTFEHTMDDPDHFAALAAFCEATPSIRVGRAPLDATIAAIEAAVAVAVAAG